MEVIPWSNKMGLTSQKDIFNPTSTPGQPYLYSWSTPPLLLFFTILLNSTSLAFSILCFFFGIILQRIKYIMCWINRVSLKQDMCTSNSEHVIIWIYANNIYFSYVFFLNYIIKTNSNGTPATIILDYIPVKYFTQ